MFELVKYYSEEEASEAEQFAASQTSATPRRRDPQSTRISPVFVLLFSTAVALAVILVASRKSKGTMDKSDVGDDVVILPPADQQWRHSTTSVAMLMDALRNDTITAIETDVLMGYDTSVDPLHEHAEIPITAHPPAIESDLSMATFVDMATSNNENKEHRVLRKHVKLDFKELQVIEPSLKEVTKFPVDANSNMIYLNADILPGPGNREDANIEANAFLSTCLRLIDSDDHSVSFYVCLCFLVYSLASTQCVECQHSYSRNARPYSSEPERW